MNDRLLSTAQAARFLGLKPQTLRKWRTTGGRGGGGHLPYVRLGNTLGARVVYSHSSILAWLAERTHRATSELRVSSSAIFGRGASSQ